MKEKIIIKKIISLTLAFSFLIMSVTGIMLYIVPKGKIAYWANWKMFGLTKTQYADVHMTSMILFLVVTIWHIFYNWKPIVSYLKDSTRKITFFKKELLIALTLNILFVGGPLMNVQPFQSILDINNNIKNYWEREYGSPPYGHAEESSLKSFSKRLNIDAEDAIARLKEKGIKIDSSKQTLIQISEQNSISSKALYNIIKPKQSSSKNGKIEFLGRKTLDELANLSEINLEKSIIYLQKEGFEASSQTRMKKAANALETTPFELYEKLKVLK
ncbi:MAG: biotin operon repressor [Sulfurimonas sp.]|jgi:biotin operon repressor